jgi:hypothetical protein
VLGDSTTRIKRTFVPTVEAITPAMTEWITEHTVFQHPHVFDSSLVSSPIEGYLEQVDVYPHLWRP